MYKVDLHRGPGGIFANILKDGKLIEPLSGLYVADKTEADQLKEMVRLANLGLKKENNG